MYTIHKNLIFCLRYMLQDIGDDIVLDNVSFSKLARDFTINIRVHDQNLGQNEREYILIISNERIEYFLAELSKENPNIKIIFKNCSVAIKCVDGSDVGDTDKIEIYDEFKKQNEQIKLKISKLLEHVLKMFEKEIDFPRHPFNKNQTDILLQRFLMNCRDMKIDDIFKVRFVNVGYDVDVKQVFNRHQYIPEFKSCFEREIRPFLEKGKVNCFIITEIGVDPIEQKHSFLLINIENNYFLLDSASHEKLGYGELKSKLGIKVDDPNKSLIELEDMPNIAMILDYVRSIPNGMIYYNHNRLQADHVNCYTFSLATLENIALMVCEMSTKCDKSEVVEALNNYLCSFFPVQVAPNVSCEGSLPIVLEVSQGMSDSDKKEFKEFSQRIILPPEFLVNTQLNNGLLKAAKTLAGEEEFRNCEVHICSANYKFKTYLTKALKRSEGVGFVRGKKGDVVKKEDQSKAIDEKRKEMLTYCEIVEKSNRANSVSFSR